jgi:hypothetical protein
VSLRGGVTAGFGLPAFSGRIQSEVVPTFRGIDQLLHCNLPVFCLRLSVRQRKRAPLVSNPSGTVRSWLWAVADLAHPQKNSSPPHV